MPYTIAERTYSSKKHHVFEYIFNRKNPTHKTEPGVIPFTLQDITNAYDALGIPKPASVSNTVLDLFRQDRGIETRLPKTIIALGFDLRRRVGQAPNGESYAGEFVFVGIGGSLSSFLKWPLINDIEVTIHSNSIPSSVLHFLSKDESALFSVVDYCDILSLALNNAPGSIKRVQNPIKLQPNEIDGFYVSDDNAKFTIYPVEAKALSTGDSINIVQFMGAVNVCAARFSNLKAIIVPIAIMMTSNGVRIAEFESTATGEEHYNAIIKRTILVNLDPRIPNWV